MNTLEELKKVREESYNRIIMKGVTNGFRLQVGMGTCGIASGAKTVFAMFLDEIMKNNLTNVNLTQVGCMGECAYEPMAELIDKNGQTFIYCNLTEITAKEVFDRHILNNEPVLRLLLTTKKG